MRPGASQLNSSEGFKRRLIRPSSSRGTNQNPQFLKTFDISQNEITIATIAKADLNSLQDDINSIDIDKRIRSEDISLGKNYVTILKKWLKQVQNNPTLEEDEAKVLKYLNVDNLASGFKKLWKITQYLDTLVTKSNELQAVVFLKYDQLFTSLSQSINPITKKLNLLGQGFSASSFQTTSIYIQRIQDLYSMLTKNKKNDRPVSISKQQLDETKAESQKLIAQLREENSKLSKYLQQLTNKKQEKSINKSSEKIQKAVEITAQNSNLKVQKSALDVAISQISSSYQNQLQDLSTKLRKALDSEAHLKLQLRSCKQSLQSLKKQSKQNKPLPSSNSYEAVLKEQLDNMKKGFENKIAKMKEDYFQREKELMRKQNQYRVQNQKIRFQRQLLMKKYDLAK